MANNIKQKLFYVSDINKKTYKDLDNYLAEGWKIKNMSACATSSSNYCWVLLEKDESLCDSTI